MDITAITYDSRKAAAGSLFVCLVGAWLTAIPTPPVPIKTAAVPFLVEHTLDLPADAVQIVTDRHPRCAGRYRGGFLRQPCR